MRLTPKQKIAQRILSENDSIKVGKVTLLYTPVPASEKSSKATVVVSVPKKIVPKAVNRNYIKRVLRTLLRESLTKEIFLSYYWMWICKTDSLSKELRQELKEQLESIKHEKISA